MSLPTIINDHADRLDRPLHLLRLRILVARAAVSHPAECRFSNQTEFFTSVSVTAFWNSAPSRHLGDRLVESASRQDSAWPTRTYARGVKSIVSQLVEDIVFEVRQGTVRLGDADVRRAVEAAGLAAVTTSC
jgi:hypothetical protein